MIRRRSCIRLAGTKLGPGRPARRVIFCFSGSKPDPGEAIEWAIQVEPFVEPSDSKRMPSLLVDAGYAEVNVHQAIKNQVAPTVRSAEIDVPSDNRFSKGDGVAYLL